MSDKTDKAVARGADDQGTAGKEDAAAAHASGGRRGRRSSSLDVGRIRGLAARIVWVACLVIALILAAAAFSFALDANERNNLVQTVRDLANFFDLGLFDLDNPVWRADADEPNADVKTALANYGAAAVGYLIVGRFAERIIRP